MFKTKRTIINLAVVIAACWIGSPANAHFVWVERHEDGQARAYFGEWAEDLHEKTGGRLDTITVPRAFTTSPDSALPIDRRADHFEISVKNPSADLRFLALREETKEGNKSRTIYYAKAGRSETVGKLDLELVPTDPGGSTFILLFRGKPMPKADVTVIGPPKWEKPLHTDDQGRITVPTPWSGPYVLEASHVEEKTGGTGSEPFNRTRHVSTLWFIHPGGQPWPASK